MSKHISDSDIISELNRWKTSEIHQTVHILERQCSSYTEDNIILGVFKSKSKANDAKSRYIEHIKSNGDPHKNQSYMTIDLDRDLGIDEYSCINKSNNQIYILFDCLQSQGQGFRNIRYVSSDLNFIQQMKKELNDKAKGMTYEPYFDFECLKPNELRFENDW
jgi:hypothetical protein